MKRSLCLFCERHFSFSFGGGVDDNVGGYKVYGNVEGGGSVSIGMTSTYLRESWWSFWAQLAKMFGSTSSWVFA